MVRICIDAMGGDYAPEAIVQGCLDAVRDDTSLALTLFGKEEAIMPFLQKAGAEPPAFCIAGILRQSPPVHCHAYGVCHDGALMFVSSERPFLHLLG